MKTIIAAFRDQPAAEQAIAFLRTRGVTDIEMMSRDTGGTSFAHWRELNIPDDRARLYADALQRGAPVIAAHTERDAESLANELDRLGSLDLHAGSGMARGTTEELRGEASRDVTTRDTARRDVREDLSGRDTLPTVETQAQPGYGATGEAGGRNLDVIEEHVVVGTREVSRGGVRVHTFVVERPVHEDVQLTEERIEVEREAVNEPISVAVAEAALHEEEFEVTARGEEVVVGKEARVVERVHVGKVAETRTESVDETEKRQDVEVERIGEAELGPDRRPRR